MDVKEIRLKLNLTHNLSYFIKGVLIMERITIKQYNNEYVLRTKAIGKINEYGLSAKYRILLWRDFYSLLRFYLQEYKINKIYQTDTVYTVYLR
jgi:hypothetical protein